MATLQVRNMPDNLYKKLRDKANKEYRSIAQQVIYELENALEYSVENKKRRRNTLEKIRQNKPKVKYSDPVELIRADRDR
jgi:plasmid stability protein